MSHIFKSDDYKHLVTRLKDEVRKLYQLKNDIDSGTIEKDKDFYNQTINYIDYHNEVIRLIKKIDSEREV